MYPRAQIRVTTHNGRYAVKKARAARQKKNLRKFLSKRLTTISWLGLRCLFIAVVGEVMGSHLFAQVTSYQVQGRVLDPSNAAVAGAHVMAIPEGSSAGPSAVSDQTGQFTLILPVGNYTFRISARDFLEASQPVEVGNSPEPL